jgi:hypothetical protein
MENFSDLGTARAVGRETLWPETYGESRDSQSPLRACSACAGDYEDPDRTAWTPDEEEEDLPVEMAQEKAENGDEFPAQEV